MMEEAAKEKGKTEKGEVSEGGTRFTNQNWVWERYAKKDDPRSR